MEIRPAKISGVDDHRSATRRVRLIHPKSLEPLCCQALSISSVLWKAQLRDTGQLCWRLSCRYFSCWLAVCWRCQITVQDAWLRKAFNILQLWDCHHLGVGIWSCGFKLYIFICICICIYIYIYIYILLKIFRLVQHIQDSQTVH